MERNIVSLLPGWEEAIDPSSGRTYYANRSTGEVTWLPPLSLPPPPPSLPPPPLSLTALPQQHNQHTTVTINSTNNAVIQSNINSTTATSNVSNTHHTSYATILLILIQGNLILLLPTLPLKTIIIIM